MYGTISDCFLGLGEEGMYGWMYIICMNGLFTTLNKWKFCTIGREAVVSLVWGVYKIVVTQSTGFTLASSPPCACFPQSQVVAPPRLQVFSFLKRHPLRTSPESELQNDLCPVLFPPPLKFKPASTQPTDSTRRRRRCHLQLALSFIPSLQIISVSMISEPIM